MEQNKTTQAAMPKFTGLSHVCIFVDDMMEAVEYYKKLLGVVPDHYLSHWRNEGFFKAGGFINEAADGDVSIALIKLTQGRFIYKNTNKKKTII